MKAGGWEHQSSRPPAFAFQFIGLFDQVRAELTDVFSFLQKHRPMPGLLGLPVKVSGRRSPSAAACRRRQKPLSDPQSHSASADTSAESICHKPVYPVPALAGACVDSDDLLCRVPTQLSWVTRRRGSGAVEFLFRLPAARAAPVIAEILKGHSIVLCRVVDIAADGADHCRIEAF